MIKVTLEFSNQDELVAFFLQTTDLFDVDTGAPMRSKAPKVEVPKSTAKAEKPVATPAAATKAAKPEAATESPSDPKPAPADSPAAPAASSSKPAASVDYPTLQKAVFTLANKSREAAGEVAATFGVKTFKELPEAKWGEALAAVNAKIAELA